MTPRQPEDAGLLAALRQTIKAVGVAALIIDDLRLDDIDRITWVGDTHLDAVAKALARVAGGDVAYLAVRAPDGQPLAKGGIDFAAHADAATLWQLVTHPGVRGLGLGTALITAAEKRSQDRGIRSALIGVEDSNPRARALYERLGYRPVGSESASWWQDGPTGKAELYVTEVTLLGKSLRSR